MSSISVTDIGPDRYGVEVDEGHLVTSHEVVITPAVLDELGVAATDAPTVVHESIAFLLDRIPATSIANPLEIAEVAAHHPDYREELRARLSAT